MPMPMARYVAVVSALVCAPLAASEDRRAVILERARAAQPLLSPAAMRPGDNTLTMSIRLGSGTQAGWGGTLPVFLSSPAFDDEFLGRVLDSMARQARYLSRHLTAVGNWRIAQLDALIFTALRLPFLPGAREWLDIGVQGQRNALATQFLPDGVHIERTPGYADWMTRVAANAGQVFSRTAWEPGADYVAFDAGTWGGGHNHLSRLSFVFRSGGRNQSGADAQLLKTAFTKEAALIQARYQGGYWDGRFDWGYSAGRGAGTGVLSAVLLAAYQGAQRPQFAVKTTPGARGMHHLEITLPGGATDFVSWSDGLSLAVDDDAPFVTDATFVWRRRGPVDAWFAPGATYLRQGGKPIFTP